MTTEVHYISYENWVLFGEAEGGENDQKPMNYQTETLTF